MAIIVASKVNSVQPLLNKQHTEWLLNHDKHWLIRLVKLTFMRKIQRQTTTNTSGIIPKSSTEKPKHQV